MKDNTLKPSHFCTNQPNSKNIDCHESISYINNCKKGQIMKFSI